MNIYQLLLNELNARDWPLSLKERYLYLRICEIFCYDCRFMYSSTKFQDELCEKKINLENVKDNRIVCINWAKDVYAVLREEFFHRKTQIVGNGHLKAMLLEEDIVADACLGSDLSRVKIGCQTNGYNPLDETNHGQFRVQLKTIDEQISYLRGEYVDKLLKKKIAQLKQEFSLKYLEGLVKKEDYLAFKIEKFKEFLGQFPNIIFYSDVNYLKQYLLRIFFQEELQAHQLASYHFHQGKDETLSFVEIDYLKQVERYFLLEQTGQTAKFQEIPKQDAMQYMDSLEVNQVNKRG